MSPSSCSTNARTASPAHTQTASIGQRESCGTAAKASASEVPAIATSWPTASSTGSPSRITSVEDGGGEGLATASSSP